MTDATISELLPSIYGFIKTVTDAVATYGSDLVGLLILTIVIGAVVYIIRTAKHAVKRR